MRVVVGLMRVIVGLIRVVVGLMRVVGVNEEWVSGRG